MTNQAPLVRRLVVGGSNVLLRDGHGNTPLHLACREGFFECAKALCIPIAQEERQAALHSINDAICEPSFQPFQKLCSPAIRRTTLLWGLRAHYSLDATHATYSND